MFGFEDRSGVIWRSSGQAPGGQNVIFGMFDYLQERCKGSSLYGFKGGPVRIMNGKYVVLTPKYIYLYRFRFQFKQAEDTTTKLDLDGLVIIGGDDSNTNALHQGVKNLIRSILLNVT